MASELIVGREAEFIKIIVEKIREKLSSHPVLPVALYRVGSKTIVEDINSWLQDGSDDVSIGMILGMSGIGKTDIAKIAYNMNYKKFECSSFLLDVKKAKKDKDLVRFQKQICSAILKNKVVTINNSVEGITRIQKVAGTRKILLVLDNVDDLKQVDKIMRMKSSYGRGSKILITTGNRCLFESHDQIFKVELKCLDPDESLKLFSLYAFGLNDPPESYKELSKSVVSHCEGLPLALKVLGNSFQGKSVEYCNKLLKDKSNIGDILNYLEISYDSLENDIKDLFLDIACFFVGEYKDYVVKIYENDDDGIQKLIDRCLISVDYSKRLRMHQLLQKMGRNVVFKKSPNDPGKQSRLWKHFDASSVIKHKKGTREIIGIMLNKNVENSMLLEDLSTDGFKKMHCLRLLSISNVRKLTGSYETFPSGIRWLCCHGLPLEFLPPCLNQLVSLDMRKSKLKKLDKSVECSHDLAKLKYFNLSHSHDLISITGLSKLTSLETLILKDCMRLVEVHGLSTLTKLETLILKNCVLVEVLDSIDYLPKLTSLNLGGCMNLRRFMKNFYPPISLPVLSTLKSLELSYCNVTNFSSALSSLSSLRYLDLSGNPIRNICAPDNIKSLLVLLMFDCTYLEELCYLPSSLKCLCIEGCTLLKSLTFDHDHVNIIHYIFSRGYNELLEAGNVFKLETIGNTDSEIKKRFGLPHSLESISSTEVEMFNGYTDKASMLPLQVLYEDGIYSIYLIANDVRDCFGWKLNGSETWFNAPLLSESPIFQISEDIDLKSIFVTGGKVEERFGWKPMEETPEAKRMIVDSRFQFSLERKLECIIGTDFAVPDWANHKIGGFNIGIVFARDKRKTDSKGNYSWLCDKILVAVINQTSDEWCLEINYKPKIFGVTRGFEDMIWLSHWKTEGRVRAGDIVTIDIFGLNDYYVIQELGIHLVYE